MNGSYKNDLFQMNEEETVDNLLFYLDQDTFKQNGFTTDQYNIIQHRKKIKSKIMHKQQE